MANKDAIINKFNVDEATVTETIKKGKYRVFNGNDYDVVYLQTSADQVIESNDKKFVSQAEKNKWDNKADGNHNHDKVYAKIGDSHTKAEMEGLLNAKSHVGHTHTAASIEVDSTHRFVTDADKDKWNDTYSTALIDSKVKEVADSVKSLDAANATAHSSIIKGYQDADKDLNSKVTTVQGNLDKAVTDLTALINTGEDANTALAATVNTIEKTTIPGINTKISDLDTKFSASITTLTSTKAEKTQVATDILAAKNELKPTINAKADLSYVNTELGKKANADNVYTISDVNDKLSTKAEKSYVSTELGKKVDKTLFTTELNKKADAEATTSSLNSKASKQELESGLASKAAKVHTHNHTEITGLGTAATLNVGIESGNIPLLNEKGQLETSVLPSIAINKKVVANNADEAMTKKMDIGDILILTNAAREAAIEKQRKGEAITYQVARSKSYQELSDEYTTYIASGRMTYLCVDDKANTFEEKFKPLQSSGDTISAAEVQAKLDLKVNNSDFESYKGQVTNKLKLKADQSTTYTKTEVNTELDKKVTKETGKQLSTNDFTHVLKAKLDGIAEGANKYVHPDDDGHLHVPATSTTNSGKFLMAGSSAGSLSWVKPNTEQITETSSKKFVTPNQISKWDSKAEGTHEHNQYRLISDSFSKTQTTAEINKLKTIISNVQPSAGTHIAGAVWIQEI